MNLRSSAKQYRTDALFAKLPHVMLTIFLFDDRRIVWSTDRLEPLVVEVFVGAF